MTLSGRRRGGSRRGALLRVGGVLAAAVTLAAGCGGNAPTTNEQGQTTATISMASYSLAGTPILAGLALNTYGQQNLALRDVPAGGSSSNVISAVLSGDAQIGFAGGTTVVDAIQEGAPITIIGAVTTCMQELVLRPDVAARLAPVTPQSPARDRVHALRGLTIATAPASSSNNVFFQGMLRSQGLDPARDVEIVPSDPAAIVAGIRDGLFDGGFWSPGVLEQNIADGSGVMWINTPAGDIPQLRQCYQAFSIASDRTVASQQALVDSYIRGTQAAATQLQEQEEATKEAVRQAYFTELDPNSFSIGWDAAEPSFVEDQLVSQQDFANHIGVQSSFYGGTYDRVNFAEAVYPLAKRQ